MPEIHDEIVELLARHAQAARLEGVRAWRAAANEWEVTLAWIRGQAISAMELSAASDGADEDLRLLNSLASDIAINAEMLADKLRSLDPLSIAEKGV